MKLDTKLFINDVSYPLISYDISLRLSDAGRGTFSVQASSAPSGVVFFDAGYSAGNYHRYFIGYVASATKQSDKHYLIVAIELVNALKAPVPVSLRHCYFNDVLTEITKSTALTMSAGAGAGSYSSVQASRVNANADGFYALKACERVFGIDDFAFYQAKDGSVWCGAWTDSPYAALGNIEIDEKLFHSQQANSVTLAPLPALRPGMMLNGKTIRFIRLSGHKMVIRWTS